jgi:hypothetical protein
MGSTKTTKWEVQRRQNGKYKDDKMGSKKPINWKVQRGQNEKYKDDKEEVKNDKLGSTKRA